MRFLLTLILLGCAALAIAAPKTIYDLPSATSLTGDSWVWVQRVRGATNDYRLRLDQVLGANSNKVIRVESWGNDTLAGTLTGYPYSTITNAFVAATTNTTILVGPGDYYQTTQIRMPTGSKLIGSGRGGVTRIICNFDIANGVTYNFGTNTVIANLTLQATNQVVYCAMVGSGELDLPFTNAVIVNCDLFGITDCIYLVNAEASQLRVADCTLTSDYDAVVSLASYHRLRIENTHIISDGGVGTANGLNLFEAIVDMYGGSVVVRGGGVACNAVLINNAASVVSLYGVDLRTEAGSGPEYAINNQAGIVRTGPLRPAFYLEADQFSATNAMDVPVTGNLWNYGGSIETPTMVSGAYSLGKEDTLIAVDVRSAGATNNLPDIGQNTTVNLHITNNPANGNTLSIGNRTRIWTNGVSSPTVLFVPIGSSQSDTATKLATDSYYSWTISNGTNLATILPSASDWTPADESSSGVGLTFGTNSAPFFSGKMVKVVDQYGSGATNNITIVPKRDQRIMGLASIKITNNFGVKYLQAIGTNWNLISEYP